MLKHAVITFSEFALWLVIAAIATSGCDAAPSGSSSSGTVAASNPNTTERPKVEPMSTPASPTKPNGAARLEGGRKSATFRCTANSPRRA